CDLAYIRLDRAEWIICGLRRGGFRQRVEERRLADIRQSDDAAFEAHGVTFLSLFLRPAKRVDNHQVADFAPVLQIFAEKDTAAGQRRGREQDTVPPRKSVFILDVPRLSCNAQVVGSRDKDMQALY